jgi:hypothetical protein
MSSPAQPSNPECENLLQLMQRSESLYLAALENVSPAQAAFKPGSDRWSIEEVAEHVVAVEEFLLMLTKNASPSTEETDLRMDERLHRGAANRRRTFEAPEGVRPCGRFRNLSETAAQFCDARRKTVEYLQQSQAALRRLRVAHPVAGNIDAYQNLLILAYHPERHAAQIAEVKAHPAYPA